MVNCGHTLKGDIVFSLNYTDVSTLWCIVRAQWNKGQIATQESLSYIKSVLPWKMLEVHPDTGSEFINWNLKTWCDTNNIMMSRSRPNHKNDNMHVEDGKWKKRYEKVAKTPYQRVLENDYIEEKVKEKLRKEHEKLNPLVMKKEIDRLKKILYDVQRKHGTSEF